MAKILYIHHRGNIGGAGLSLLNVVRMISECHEVIVKCPESPSSMSALLSNNGICVETYDTPTPIIPAYKGSRLSLSTLRGIVQLKSAKAYWYDQIRQHNPDIVIVNSMTLSWLGSIIHESSAKAICFVRETSKNPNLSFAAHYIKRRLNNDFDGVFFISEFDKRHSECTAPMLTTVKNTVAVEEYELSERITSANQLGIDPMSYNIAFVGGISRLKGTHLAVKAIACLKDIPNIRIIIVGANMSDTRSHNVSTFNLHNLYVKSISRLLKKHDLQKKVLFLDTQSDVRHVYAASDLLIFPSTKPHQARPVFEAGAARLPVIISDFPQTSEYVKHGYNGLLFKPNDYKDLADKIKIIYDKRELREELGNNNYEMSIKNHSFGKVKPILLDAIDKVLSL